MKICLLLLPLALTACMTAFASPTHATAPTTDSSNMSASATTLARYHWQLRNAVDSSNRHLDALFGQPDKSLQLDFTADAVSVRNACNNINGSYSLVDGHLDTTSLRQTMMACADRTLMQREATIKELLRSRPALTLSMAGDTTQLTLAVQNGSTLTFAGAPTAETQYGSTGETVFLEVAAQPVPCQHPLIPNKMCLQVRERHYDAQGLRSGQPGPWQALQQDIEGYVHQPGTRNVLRVKRYAIKQPPADAPSSAYVLDMVVESEIVKPSDSAGKPAQPQQP